METQAASPVGVSTMWAEAGALAVVARAVRKAKRASDDAYLGGSSTRQPPTNYRSLGLVGWNRHGTQSLNRLADGDVAYTSAPDVARRTTAEGAEGVEINVVRWGRRLRRPFRLSAC
eukprot:4440869-Pleurochrysis_carterae.AAC.1